MNDRTNPFSELLSAWHDSEATDAERAAVERMLEESGAAREELDDFAAIGRLLRELPAESLPPEFRAQVLHAAERSMLLPRDEAAAPRRGPRGAAWAGLGGLLAAAAAVVLAVVLLERPPADEQFATRGPEAESSDGDRDASDLPADAVVARKEFESREERMADRGRDAVDAFDAEGAPAVAEPGPVADARRVDRTAERAAGVAGGPANEALPRSTTVAPSLEFQNKELAEALVGQVVEALDMNGEQIFVVRLTVVDREAGLDAVRLLLARHRIPLQEVAHAPLEASAANDGRRDGLVAGEADALRGETEMLEAVFVQASTAQLSAVLDELHEVASVRDLSVEAPIALAGLDLAARRRVVSELKVQDGRGRRESFSPAAAAAAERATNGGPEEGFGAAVPKPAANAPLPVRPGSRSAADDSPSATAAKSSRDDKVPSSKDEQEAARGVTQATEDSAAVARQVSPSLSRQLLQGRDLGRDKASMAREAAAVATDADAAPSAAPVARAPVAPGRAGWKTVPHNLQVLFVLVSDKGRGTAPAPPAPPQAVPADPAADADDGAA
ncbi:MAG: hypothetical protein WD069_11355 [Planctomycetales bacterium]